MTELVVDASVVASWFFDDEQNDYADSLRLAVEENEVSLIVPPLFLSEISNIFLSGEKRKRLTVEKSTPLLRDVSELPIEIYRNTRLLDVPKLARIGRKHSLSAYDASYLFTAQELNIALATLDGNLERATKAEGGEIWTRKAS